MHRRTTVPPAASKELDTRRRVTHQSRATRPGRRRTGGYFVRISIGRRARHALGVLAIVAVAAAGCGSDEKNGGGGTNDTTASKSDPNGIIKVGYDLIQQPGTIILGDPIKADSSASSTDALYYLVFGRFMRQNADGTLTPQLAKSATVTDKNTITIVLRDGLTFSDGTKLDAAAVKAGLERSVASNNTNAFLETFFTLKSVDVVSPTEVKLNFPGGTAGSWFDQFIAAWQTSIVKPGDTDLDKPTGAGPMKIVSYARGQKLVLAKNDKYYDPSAIKVAGMEFTHIANASPQSGIAALRQGQIDITFTDPSQLASLSGDIEAFPRISPDQSVWIHICKRSGPLANEKVRVALNKAINREAINKAVFQGTAEPSTGLWPKGHKFSNPDTADFLDYDPEGAKKLLKEAGFEKFSVDVYPIAFAGIPETAEAMKQQLAEVGITLNIKSTTNYVNDYLQPQADGLGIFPGNAIGVFKLNGYTGDGLGNVCRWNDPEITELTTKLSGLSASDPEAEELWHQAEEIVVKQALTGFVLFRSALAAYNTTRLGDLTSLQLGQYVVPDPTETYVKAS
jgi:peptide/nickel transport system substrate-binding protein